jgi:hypothetical protein
MGWLEEPAGLAEPEELEERFQATEGSVAQAEPEVWAEPAAREQTELME